ncbi:MAG: thioesterase family protein [Acidimicrobiales bacterium]
MSWLLDERTQLEPLGDGRYRRLIDDGEFWGTGSPFGGYLMALGFAAMRAEVEDRARRPRVYTHQFLRRVPVGALELAVTTERVGALVHAVSVRLHAGGDVVGVAGGLFTGEQDGPSYLDDPMPTVDPPTEPGGTEVPGWATNVHARFTPHRRFGADGLHLPNEDGGWLVMNEPGPWDHRLALMASDVWPLRSSAGPIACAPRRASITSCTSDPRCRVVPIRPCSSAIDDQRARWTDRRGDHVVGRRRPADPEGSPA